MIRLTAALSQQAAVPMGRTPCRVPALAATVLCVLLAGCGGPTLHPVRGQVVFEDGTPVRSGRVEFRPRGGGPRASGTLDTEGRFTLSTLRPDDGAVIGEHDVIVVQMIITEDLLPEQHEDHGRRVPRRYADYFTSDLEATVEAGGPNEIRLQIADD